jgi:hypothetical protein
MCTSNEKKRLKIIAITGMLCLLLTSYHANAQTDSNAGKKLFTDTMADGLRPGQKTIPPYYLSPVIPVSRYSFLNNQPFVPNPYRTTNESNASKTILKILGIGALTLFGDRSNHSYQPNNQHW